MTALPWLPRLTGVVLSAVLCAVAPWPVLAAQPPDASAGDPTIAFVNVNTITMADDLVRRDQVVLVRRDRIVAVGASTQIPVPDDAVVIDGEGRFLVPASPTRTCTSMAMARGEGRHAGRSAMVRSISRTG